MTRALVLYAHPCDDSFAATLHRTVVGTLSERGWEVDDCDLYKEGFEPVLTTAERRGYHDEPENIEPVKDYVERLRKADALILCFPVWNFGYPAILKGFLDRVFLPGVSFKLVDGKVLPNLKHIKKLAAVTTTKMRYLALYDMNRASDGKRADYVEKVRREMEDL